jgi:hypothetical protein
MTNDPRHLYTKPMLYRLRTLFSASYKTLDTKIQVIAKLEKEMLGQINKRIQID